MGKVQRSISIDEDLNQLFEDDPTINASAFINRLIRRYIEEMEKKQE